MKSTVSRSCRRWIYGTVLFVSIISGSSAKDEGPVPFLKKGEIVRQCMNHRVYTVDTGTKSSPPRTHAHTFTKIHFTNGKNKILKTFDIFPAGSQQRSAWLQYFTDYYVLYRYFSKDGKIFRKQFIFNDQGEELGARTEADAAIYWDGSKRRVLVIDGMEGTLSVFSTEGSKISFERFSKQVEHVKGGMGGDDDDGSDFGVSSAASPEGRFIALGRNKTGFHELTLISVDGKVLFQRKDKVFKMSPMIVDSKDQVLVTVENKEKEGVILDGSYLGYDFRGKKLWKFHGNKQFLKFDQATRILHVQKRDEPQMETHQHLDLRTGRVLLD